MYAHRPQTDEYTCTSHCILPHNEHANVLDDVMLHPSIWPNAELATDEPPQPALSLGRLNANAICLFMFLVSFPPPLPPPYPSLFAMVIALHRFSVFESGFYLNPEGGQHLFFHIGSTGPESGSFLESRSHSLQFSVRRCADSK